jgi:hypothetical protein
VGVEAFGDVGDDGFGEVAGEIGPKSSWHRKLSLTGGRAYYIVAGEAKIVIVD